MSHKLLEQLIKIVNNISIVSKVFCFAIDNNLPGCIWSRSIQGIIMLTLRAPIHKKISILFTLYFLFNFPIFIQVIICTGCPLIYIFFIECFSIISINREGYRITTPSSLLADNFVTAIPNIWIAIIKNKTMTFLIDK